MGAAVLVFNEDDYPESMKLTAIADKSNAIGEFLDNSGFILAEYVDGDRYEGEPATVLVPVSKGIQEVLAGYFEIDLTKLEKEKRAMLELLREGQ